MPTPVFILCAHDVIQDQESRLVSVIKIVEKIIIWRPEPAEGDEGDELVELKQLPSFHLRAVAVWRKEPGDQDREFEAEFAFVVNMDEVGVQQIPIAFKQKGELSRLLIAFPAAVFSEEGEGHVVCRVRESGTTDWIQQRYSLPIERTITLPGT